MVGETKNLVYLNLAGVVELTPNTALVGHDGWADGRLGDFEGSDVILNDFLLIDELRCWRDSHTLDKPALRRVLELLGDEAAGYLRSVLAPAAEKYPQVIVATHVPPFREAAWHQGRPSSDDFLPFFACKAVGDVLLELAQSHPGCQILVLCGHTHGGGEVQVLENLRVVTGPAEYGEAARSSGSSRWSSWAGLQGKFPWPFAGLCGFQLAFSPKPALMTLFPVADRQVIVSITDEE